MDTAHHLIKSMKQIIKTTVYWLKRIAIMVVISIMIVGGAFLYFQNKHGVSTYESETPTTTAPQVVTEIEYKERYDELVKQIVDQESQYWADKARLSAERQAAEQLADEFAEKANAKRLEEESL